MTPTTPPTDSDTIMRTVHLSTWCPSCGVVTGHTRTTTSKITECDVCHCSHQGGVCKRQGPCTLECGIRQ